MQWAEICSFFAHVLEARLYSKQYIFFAYALYNLISYQIELQARITYRLLTEGNTIHIFEGELKLYSLWRYK